MLTLPVKQLVPGDVIVSDVLTREGLMLIRAGSTLTAMTIHRLGNFSELGEAQEPVLVQRPEAASSPATITA